MQGGSLLNVSTSQPLDLSAEGDLTVCTKSDKVKHVLADIDTY
jgi:hypothetical protein